MQFGETGTDSNKMYKSVENKAFGPEFDYVNIFVYSYSLTVCWLERELVYAIYKDQYW